MPSPNLASAHYTQLTQLIISIQDSLQELQPHCRSGVAGQLLDQSSASARHLQEEAEMLWMAYGNEADPMPPALSFFTGAPLLPSAKPARHNSVRMCQSVY